MKAWYRIQPPNKERGVIKCICPNRYALHISFSFHIEVLNEIYYIYVLTWQPFIIIRQNLRMYWVFNILVTSMLYHKPKRFIVHYQLQIHYMKSIIRNWLWIFFVISSFMYLYSYVKVVSKLESLVGVIAWYAIQKF